MESPRTVFIVEDDPQMQEMLRAVLQGAGLRVVVSATAEEFLARLGDQVRGVGCVLLDVRMPGIGGLGLQEIMNRDGIGLPIVFLSVVADIGLIVHAMQAGAIDFLHKSVPPHTLRQRVERALDIAARWQAERAAVLDYRARLASLTAQERRTFELLVDGLSSKEIAHALDVCIPTVARHRAGVLRKIKVRNAVELAREAWLCETREHYLQMPHIRRPHFLSGVMQQSTSPPSAVPSLRPTGS